MKLIDILVQELPKVGGWPREVDALVQSSKGAVYKAGGGFPVMLTYLADDWELAEVTREQYEAALAQTEWNGEGLPPVGALCQYQDYSDTPWVECKVLAYHNNECWLQRTADGTSFIMGNPHLHPIRSEAERKRDEAVAALKQHKPQLVGELAGYLYDEIAAGKIPHIQIK